MHGHLELLVNLGTALPKFSELGPDANINAQACAVLGWVIQESLAAPECSPESQNPYNCANCKIKPGGERTPYCSEACKEETSFVRQVRCGLESGAILVPDRQVALGQSLWHILGGGYPLRRTLVSAKDLERFLAKNPNCAYCGLFATNFDHIKTACNRPINLRAVCEGCSTTRAFGDSEYLVTANPKVKLLAQRIRNVEPLRPSDTTAWDWRAYLASRLLHKMPE